MSDPPQRVTGRRRTWSALGDLRRVPSEYEIVTHDTNYTLRKNAAAPLEQNVSSVANLWLVTYRDRSPLRVDDWLEFRDPDETTYRAYVTMQAQQETIISGVLDEYAAAERDKCLTPGWRSTLGALFTPLRFPLHGLQMCTAYFGQMAPSSYITNCAAFATADLLRFVSLVAYRTRELSRAFPDSGIGMAERRQWEQGAAWQGTRKALELALIAYDWAESFTAVNLVLRPTLDDVWLSQLGELAAANGDDEAWLLLSKLKLDAERCRRWSAALASYAIRERTENEAVFRKWIDLWAPRADDAVRGLSQILATLPEKPRSEDDTCLSARNARNTFLAGIGLHS
ncbi:MAG TPA: toluene hydroxylase [Polyangiaceae bacterium]|nr:toluene hydroxylase [Polyangiaceae bacterium]